MRGCAGICASKKETIFRLREHLFARANKTRLLLGCATWRRQQKILDFSVARVSENFESAARVHVKFRKRCASARKFPKALRECPKNSLSAARAFQILIAAGHARDGGTCEFRCACTCGYSFGHARSHLRIFLWACAKSQTTAKLAARARK